MSDCHKSTSLDRGAVVWGAIPWVICLDGNPQRGKLLSGESSGGEWAIVLLPSIAGSLLGPSLGTFVKCISN
jgi:hypothetical protein